MAGMRCGGCGAANREEASFCDRCGSPLRPGSGGRERMQAPAAEHRLVTVLFADAEGSTHLTEQIGDEAFYGMMQACVSVMTEAVEAHGGLVSQFRGDGIMALFGAPVAVEGAAVEAVTAALEMQERLAEVGADLAERVGDGVSFRVGLNTGPVIVGTLAGQTVVDYTAIGDTANVAARMEQSAGSGEVLISDATWRAVRDFVECELVGDLHVKGKAAPVRSHRARRRRDVRSRIEAIEDRGLSDFVGRADPLTELLATVDGMRAERRGGVVHVVGSPGIGKSRLLREVKRGLPAAVAWAEGRASATDSRTPWYVVSDLLRRWCAVNERDDAESIGSKISRAFPDAAPVDLDHVRWLLGASPSDVASSDPKERRASVVAAVRAILRIASARGPVVVAIEDLHWADEASVQAVDELCELSSSVPLLVVCTSRPGHDPGLRTMAQRTLVMGELSAPDVAVLADSVAGHALAGPVHELILERSGGNPLFVEELTATLVETGVLRDAGDGVWGLAAPVPDLRLPATLQDVVQARIDRLEPEARQALQLASVIGREFTRRLLDRISDPGGGLDDHIDQLQTLELIHATSTRPEVVYLFKHAVVHEVTYGTLLDGRRRELHSVVARAIEDLYPGQLDDHCESLARHWLAANDEARALEPLILSGEKAYANDSMPVALETFERAIEVAGRLSRPDRQVHLLRQLLSAHDDLGNWEAVVETSRRLSELAGALGDVEAQAVALAYRCQGITWQHDFGTALEVASEARRFAEDHLGAGVDEETFAEVAGAVQVLFMVLGRFDDYDELRARVEEVRSDLPAETAGLHEITTFEITTFMVDNWRGNWSASPPQLVVPAGRQRPPTLATWGAALHQAGLGRFADAVELLEAALRDGERIGEMFLRARVLNTLGFVHYEVGDVDGALRWNRESLDPALDVGLPKVALNARLNLADDHVATGDRDRAAAELAEVASAVRKPDVHDEWMRWRYGQHYLCTAGELALAAGDPSEARARADECIEWATEMRSPKYVVRARRLRGRALASGGDEVQAREELIEAVRHARSLGNPPQHWRSLTALAELGGSDSRDLAREALAILDGVVEHLAGSPLASTLRESEDRRAILAHL